MNPGLIERAVNLESEGLDVDYFVKKIMRTSKKDE
jgi:hypothetical protein